MMFEMTPIDYGAYQVETVCQVQDYEPEVGVPFSHAYKMVWTLIVPDPNDPDSLQFS